MPWTASDAKAHLKGATGKKARMWAAVANSALTRCMKGGKSQADCEGAAIKQANGVAGKMRESDATEVALGLLLREEGVPEDALVATVEAVLTARDDDLAEAATQHTAVQGHLKLAAAGMRKHAHPVAQQLAKHLDRLRVGLRGGYGALAPLLDPDKDVDDDTTPQGDTDHDVFPMAAADRTALAGLLLTEAASILRQDDSYDARRQAVQQALQTNPQMRVDDSDADDTDPMAMPPCLYVVDLFDDTVVYQYGDDLYRATYTLGNDEDADDVTFGTPEPCERAYVPVAEAALAERQMDPNVGGGTDRDKLPAADFAGKNRSFPIATAQDVADAAQSIGRAGADNYSTDELKANIIRIAKRKGAAFVAKLPKAWQESGAPPTSDPDTVPLVEAGALIELAPVAEVGALVGVA